MNLKQIEIEETRKKTVQTYQPNGHGSFLEAEGFEGFNSLQFFYDVGKLLDKTFSPTLETLPRIQTIASQVSRGKTEDTRLGLVDLIDESKTLFSVTEDAISVLDKGILPFEKVVKVTYQRAIEQFKYLQKRFLNIGGDDSRAYRDPWGDKNRKGGFDLARIPYVKTELVRDNALFKDIKSNEKFDLIISQLPFANVEHKDEISHFLFDPDFKIHIRFLKEAKNYLTDKGIILIPTGTVGDEDRLNELIKKNNYKIKQIKEEEFNNLTWKIYILGLK